MRREQQFIELLRDAVARPAVLGLRYSEELSLRTAHIPIQRNIFALRAELRITIL